MQNSDTYKRNILKHSYDEQPTNTLSDLLDLTPTNEQAKMRPQIDSDAIMARYNVRLQRNQICLNCTMVTCLGCCCAFLYFFNQTLALSKKCSH